MDETIKHITNDNCMLKDTEICVQMGSDCEKCSIDSMSPEQQEKLLKAFDLGKKAAVDKKTDTRPQYRKGDCLIKNTELCTMMGQKCEKCEVRRMKPPMQEKLLNTYETILTLLPEGGVSSLKNSKHCMLCKDGTAREKTCYAIFEMGHEEPKSMKRSVIGIKVRQRIGSLLTLAVASCTRCRMLYLLRDWLGFIAAAVFFATGVLGLALAGFREAISTAYEGMPYIWLGGFVVLGIIAGYLTKYLFSKAISGKVCLDLYELAQIKKMRDKGWFMLSEMEERGKQSVIFTKKPNGGLTPIFKEQWLDEK